MYMCLQVEEIVFVLDIDVVALLGLKFQSVDQIISMFAIFTGGANTTILSGYVFIYAHLVPCLSHLALLS